MSIIRNYKYSGKKLFVGSSEIEFDDEGCSEVLPELAEELLNIPGFEALWEGPVKNIDPGGQSLTPEPDLIPIEEQIPSFPFTDPGSSITASVEKLEIDALLEPGLENTQPVEEMASEPKKRGRKPVLK